MTNRQHMCVWQQQSAHLIQSTGNHHDGQEQTAFKRRLNSSSAKVDGNNIYVKLLAAGGIKIRLSLRSREGAVQSD